MIQKSKIKMSSNRSFGLVFFVVFLIISLWSFRGDFQQIKIIPLCFSILFLIFGILNSKILSPLNKVWFKFGIILGAIIAPIVMSFIFFFVVTPTGIFMKILNIDLLKKKYNKEINTYWIKANKNSGSMKKQF